MIIRTYFHFTKYEIHYSAAGVPCFSCRIHDSGIAVVRRGCGFPNPFPSIGSGWLPYTVLKYEFSRLVLCRRAGLWYAGQIFWPWVPFGVQVLYFVFCEVLVMCKYRHDMVGFQNCTDTGFSFLWGFKSCACCSHDINWSFQKVARKTYVTITIYVRSNLYDLLEVWIAGGRALVSCHFKSCHVVESLISSHIILCSAISD